MKKNQIDIKNLMAGALFCFDRFTSLDISLLMQKFLKLNPDFSIKSCTFDELKKYIKRDKDVFYIDSKSKNKVSINNTLKMLLNEDVNKFFASFDVVEFILRKVTFYTEVKEEQINQIFSDVEQAIIEKLVSKELLIWECIDNHKILKLSKLGKLKLFKIDNACEVEEFIKSLETMRYDVTIIDEFLLTQDLDKEVNNILNISQLEKFSNTYDRAITSENISSLSFYDLKKADDKLSAEAGNLLKELFNSDSNKVVYITHPNYIFKGNDLINSKVRRLYNVDWDDIDLNKMFYSEKFKKLKNRDISKILTEINLSFKPEPVDGINVIFSIIEYAYFAIVEVDSENNAVVKCIIRKDSNGNISLAFNPRYKEKSISRTLAKK